MKNLIQYLLIILTLGACLFGPAGTFHWWNGWVFLAFTLVLSILMSNLYNKYPELPGERKKAAKLAKPWDKALTAAIGLALPVSLLLSGFDKRWGWTGSLPLAVCLAALGVMVASSALTYWAISSNPFFSSYARIQEDRGQVVVSTGPYTILRHPGYAGAVFYNLAIPVMLGSKIALWAGILFCLLIVLRARLEDLMLQEGLKGYREYAQKVRYKLLPFIW